MNSFKQFPPFPRSYGILSRFSKILCCTHNKLFYIKLALIFVIAIFLVVFYFVTVGAGYWTTYVFEKFQYNITTGFPLLNVTNTTIRLICRNDMIGFYGGCFGIGMGVDVIAIILFISIYKLGQLCSDMSPHLYDIMNFLCENDTYSDTYFLVHTEEDKSFISSGADSDHLVFGNGDRSESDMRFVTFPEISDIKIGHDFRSEPERLGFKIGDEFGFNAGRVEFKIGDEFGSEPERLGFKNAESESPPSLLGM
jgi:hypothetical protein